MHTSMTMRSFVAAILGIVIAVFSRPASCQWVQSTAAVGSIECFAVIESNVFVGTDSNAHGLFRTTDNGATWFPASNGIPSNPEIRTLAVVGTHIFAGGYWGGIYVSRDYGATWDSVNHGLQQATVTALGAHGSTLFASVFDTVFVTTNEGVHWTAANNGLASYSFLTCFAFSGNNIYAGSYRDGVFLSTDGGASWNAVNNGLTGGAITISLAVIGANVFVSSTSGIFLTTNNGATWSAVNNGLSPSSPSALVVSGNTLFAGTFSRGVYRTTNMGASWDSINTGLPNGVSVHALALNGTEIFAGTYANGVWRRSLADLGIVAVDDRSADAVPVALRLKQNFPNPAGASTTIFYSLPASGPVRVSVYDAMGARVAMPVDETETAGEHSVAFPATSLKSGIYVYRLTEGTRSLSGTMVVVR